jgi:hypothetical protein
MNRIEMCREIEEMEAEQDAPKVRYMYEIARLQTLLNTGVNSWLSSYCEHRIGIASTIINVYDAAA